MSKILTHWENLFRKHNTDCLLKKRKKWGGGSRIKQEKQKRKKKTEYGRKKRKGGGGGAGGMGVDEEVTESQSLNVKDVSRVYCWLRASRDQAGLTLR